MALGRNYEQCRHLSIKREKRNNSWKKERCGTIQLALIAAITERSKIDVEANELLFIR